MVTVRTPLRVSLAGGGSDLDAFVRTNLGAVVSTTIDRYVNVSAAFAPGDLVCLRRNGVETSVPLDEVDDELVREAVRAAAPGRGLRIEIESDVPVGGTGLGSSSALLVGLVHALRALGGTRSSAVELAHEAARIEIDVLGSPIGRQDHYASALGGLRLLRFGPRDAVRTEAIFLAPERLGRLETSLLLFNVAPRGHAATVLAGIARDDDRAGLVELRELALRLHADLANGFEPEALGPYLTENWRLKRGLASGVSTPAVDVAVASVLEAGALGAKLLGAGGGGFLLVHAEPGRHQDVRTALSGAQELPFAFENEGSRIIPGKRAA